MAAGAFSIHALCSTGTCACAAKPSEKEEIPAHTSSKEIPTEAVVKRGDDTPTLSRVASTSSNEHTTSQRNQKVQNCLLRKSLEIILLITSSPSASWQNVSFAVHWTGRPLPAIFDSLGLKLREDCELACRAVCDQIGGICHSIAFSKCLAFWNRGLQGKALSHRLVQRSDGYWRDFANLYEDVLTRI